MFIVPGSRSWYLWAVIFYPTIARVTKKKKIVDLDKISSEAQHRLGSMILGESLLSQHPGEDHISSSQQKSPQEYIMYLYKCIKSLQECIQCYYWFPKKKWPRAYTWGKKLFKSPKICYSYDTVPCVGTWALCPIKMETGRHECHRRNSSENGLWYGI